MLRAYSDIIVTYENGEKEELYGVRVYALADTLSDIHLDDFETDYELPKVVDWDVVGDIYDIDWEIMD